MPKVSAAHAAGRRREILEAAARCFAREGVHAATMRDLVRESGLSPGAIYAYFGGKAEIVEALAAERQARERRWMAEAAAEGGDELTRVLRALAARYFGELRTQDERTLRRAGVQLWAEALRRPEIRALVLRGTDEPRALLARLIAEAQARGAVPAELDAEYAARAMIALFQGFVLQQAWDETVDPGRFLGVVEAALGAVLRAGGRSAAGDER